MKTISIKLRPVEALIVRLCLKRFFDANSTGERDRMVAKRIYYRIDEAYMEDNDDSESKS